MMRLDDSQTYADVSIIIKMMPTEMQEKISKNFINFIEKNKDSNYISSIDNKKPLEEQNLTENTKAILALIYRDYLCSEDERKLLLEKEKKELEKIEEEKRKLYAINFEKNKNSSNPTTNENALIVYKSQNIFQKILEKIKHFFKFSHK